MKLKLKENAAETPCEFIVKKNEPYCRTHRKDANICAARLRATLKFQASCLEYERALPGAIAARLRSRDLVVGAVLRRIRDELENAARVYDLKGGEECRSRTSAAVLSLRRRARKA